MIARQTERSIHMAESEWAIYLIQSVYDAMAENSVYKIGMTSRGRLQRYKEYPAGSKLILHMACFDGREAERNLISMFKSRFNLVRGREWFEGDPRKMREIIITYLTQDDNFDFFRIGPEGEEEEEETNDGDDDLNTVVSGDGVWFTVDTGDVDWSTVIPLPSYLRDFETIDDSVVDPAVLLLHHLSSR